MLDEPGGTAGRVGSNDTTVLIAGDPVRDPGADRDGRYGWDIPMTDGTVVRLLMPGVDLIRVRDDLTAQAPCLYVNGGA